MLKTIRNLNDNEIWLPFKDEKLIEFKIRLQQFKASIHSSNKNIKGSTLESLMTHVYKQFAFIESVKTDITHSGNQHDHIIEFLDTPFLPPFIKEKIGLRFVGESKNHLTAISVREVADLEHLLVSNECKLGIFSSYKTFSKNSTKSFWSNAEGKRRKLVLRSGKYIINFTLSDLESLECKNFYTLLKQKIAGLIDEVEDCDSNCFDTIPYPDRLIHSLTSLRNSGVINEEEYIHKLDLIETKYGNSILN